MDRKAMLHSPHSLWPQLQRSGRGKVVMNTHWPRRNNYLSDKLKKGAFKYTSLEIKHSNS